MDLVTATTTIDLSKHPDAVAGVLQGLVNEVAIRNLAALYAMAIDDHDIERVVDCFTDDGTFTRAGNTERGKQGFARLLRQDDGQIYHDAAHSAFARRRDERQGQRDGPDDRPR